MVGGSLLHGLPLVGLPNIYIYYSCVFVCLYVDDMLIMGTSKDVIMSTKRLLSSIFDMKDLGLADVILGIQIKTIMWKRF